MANEIPIETQTPIVWAGSGFSSSLNGYTKTEDITLTSLAAGAARQGTITDLGALRAPRFCVRVGFEFDVAPTAGATVEYYWSGQFSSSAGVGADGGCTGTDAAYKASEEDEWKRQLTLIGCLVATADAATTVQYMTINPDFRPGTRYGQIVVVNETTQAAEGDAVEMFVAFEPIMDEIQ